MLRRYVQTQLRELHKEQHQDIAEHLQELKQLLISGREPPEGLVTARVVRDLEVPYALQTKFAANSNSQGALDKQDSGSSSVQTVSVKDGLDAFFYHFNAVRDLARSMSIC